MKDRGARIHSLFLGILLMIAGSDGLAAQAPFYIRTRPAENPPPDPPVETNRIARLERQVAERRDPPALLELALACLDEWSPDADLEKGVRLLREASDSGLREAQFELALACSRGLAAPRGTNDLPVALLERAAQAGHRAAAFELMERYHHGLGVRQDLESMLKWLTVAEERDHYLTDETTTAIGHQRGQSKAVDRSSILRGDPMIRAAAILLDATEGDDSVANNELGQFYLHGIYLLPNPVKARAQFERAAGAGLAEAQYNVGRCYQRGIGGETNLAAALKWFILAAKNAYPKAVGPRDEIAKTIGPEFAKRAEAEAAAFRPAQAKPVEIAREPTIEEFLGEWHGRWNEAEEFQVTVTQNADTERILVVYEWEDDVGARHRQPVPGRLKDGVLKGGFFDMTLSTTEPNKANAIGHFETKRTGQLIRIRPASRKP